MADYKAQNIGLLNSYVNTQAPMEAYELENNSKKALNKILDTTIKITGDLLAKEEEINYMNLKSETDKLHSEYQAKLSDTKLYKDETKLKQVKDEYENKLSLLETKYNETKLTDKHRTSINNYTSSLKQSNDLMFDKLYNNQKFQEQQAQINLRIFETSNNALANAYDGLDGLNNVELFTKELHDTLKSQVESNLLDPSKASDTFSDTTALVSLTSYATIQKNAIMDNSMLSEEDKILALGNLKKQLSDNNFLHDMSKEISQGYTVSDQATIEVALHKNLGRITGNLDLEVNKLRGIAKLNKTTQPSELTWKETNEINQLKAEGKIWEAAVKELDAKKIPVTATKWDYLLQDLGQNFAKNPLKLEDYNSNNVPENYISDSTVKTINNNITDPFTNLGLSADASDEEIIETITDDALNRVAQEMNVELTPQNKFAVAKVLLGAKDIKGKYLPQGFDLNMLKYKYAPESSKMTERQYNEQLKKMSRQRYYRTNTVLSNMLEEANGKKDDETARTNVALIANSQGTAIRKSQLNGQSKPFFKTMPSNLNSTAKSFIRNYYNKNGIAISETNLQILTNELRSKIEKNPVIIEMIGQKAMANYSQVNKNLLVESSKNNKIVTPTERELIDDGYMAAGYMEYLEEEFSVMFNLEETMYNGVDTNIVSPNWTPTKP